MAEIQFAAQAYQARSTQLLAQQCINAFVEPTPKEGKTQLPVYGIPGLSLFSRMGNGPILGMHIMGGDLFILSGPQLWKISANDVANTAVGSPVAATFIGTTTLSGLASMADNVAQLVMVDGNVGWIYQPGGLNQITTATVAGGATTIPANIIGRIEIGDTLVIALDNGATFTTTASAASTPVDGALFLTNAVPSQVTAGAVVVAATVSLAQIQADAFMPAATVRYFDGYFVFNAVRSRQFFLSAINDGTQYSGLDFATASAGSTFIVAIEVYHEQLLIFCVDHTEVWWDAGNALFPFQRYDAAFIARGLAAPYCVCSEDNTVFWMGDDGIFYRLDNYTPKRISTFAMEHAWAQYPSRFLDSSCFVLNQEGHKFVVINFQSGQQTWVHDISTTLWHQRESSGSRWV